MLFVFVSKKLRWNAVKEFSLIFFFRWGCLLWTLSSLQSFKTDLFLLPASLSSICSVNDGLSHNRITCNIALERLFCRNKFFLPFWSGFTDHPARRFCSIKEPFMSGHSFASKPIIFVMETTTLLPKAKILFARLKLFTLLVVCDKVTVQPFLPSARFK